MHVRKVEIFIYSLFSPAEKLSLPKRLKSDLTPIIRYSNKGNTSRLFSDYERNFMIFMSELNRIKRNFHKYQIISFYTFFI